MNFKRIKLQLIQVSLLIRQGNSAKKNNDAKNYYSGKSC